jgi:hypothetical protein
MDEFKDFFKELKERATSPFFGSFIISWCLINWPIIIAIFFENNQKEKDRFTFVYDTIVKHDNFFSFFLSPFLCAVAYTFGYPYVRRLIKWHIATQTAKSDSAILNSTGIASVSLENYLIMKEAQEASQAKLSGLINDHQNVLVDQEKLRAELNDEKLNSLVLTQAKQSLQEIIDARLFFSKSSTYTGNYFYLEANATKTPKFWRIETDNITFSESDGPHQIISLTTDFDRRQITIQLRRNVSKKQETNVRSVRGMAIESYRDEELTSSIVEEDDFIVLEVSEDFKTLSSIPSMSRPSFTLSRL